MNYVLLGACFVILLTGCQEDNLIPTATSSLVSTGASSKAITFAAKEWAFFVGNTGSQGNPNLYQSSLATNGSTPISSLSTITTRSESYTLGIAASTINDTESFSYWTVALTPQKGSSQVNR